MDISIVIIGSAVLAAIALVLGITISFVTQMFHIEVDPRINQIYDILPHFNCGACGHPGCMPYAESIINEQEMTTKCKPGGAKVIENITAILNK